MPDPDAGREPAADGRDVPRIAAARGAWGLQAAFYGALGLGKPTMARCSRGQGGRVEVQGANVVSGRSRPSYSRPAPPYRARVLGMPWTTGRRQKRQNRPAVVRPRYAMGIFLRLCGEGPDIFQTPEQTPKRVDRKGTVLLPASSSSRPHPRPNFTVAAKSN